MDGRHTIYREDASIFRDKKFPASLRQIYDHFLHAIIIAIHFSTNPAPNKSCANSLVLDCKCIQCKWKFLEAFDRITTNPPRDVEPVGSPIKPPRIAGVDRQDAGGAIYRRCQLKIAAS